MNGNEFLDKLELIDQAYIEEAENIQRSKKISFVKWGALAACICIVITGVFAIQKSQNEDEPNIPSGDLVPEQNFDETASGMGFEGYDWYDISEADFGNPWSVDMGITTLPIFKNNAYDESLAGVSKGLSETDMQAKLERILSALDASSLSSESGAEKIRFVRDKADITVFADGQANIYLSKELGGAYSFTSYDTTEVKAKEVLEYFIDTYGELLDYENPTAITFGIYEIYGNKRRFYVIYDAGSDDTASILGYNFRYTLFYPDENGELYLIRMHDELSVAEEAGSVGVISLDEAKERLMSGEYKTSVPYAFPGERYIGKAELVYRSGPFEKMLLPYYCFYVQVRQGNNEAADLGLKRYGAYYVSAIADEFLDGLPLYDGGFN